MIVSQLFVRALVFHLLLIPVITLVAGLVLVSLVKLKKAPASVRAAISGTTLIVILILPWASMTIPKVPINIFPATPDAHTESVNRHLSDPGVLAPPPALSPVLVKTPQFIPPPPSVQTKPITATPISRINWYMISSTLLLGLVLIWFLGIVWNLSVLMLGFFGIIRLRRSSRVVTEKRLIEAFNAARSRLGYKGASMLLISNKISLPITWGWLRPKIALPTDAENWPMERLDSAFLHELAHIERRDFIVQTLGRFASAFQWYNPLVHRLLKIWKSEAEQACDDLVLRSGYTGEKYSQILLEVWQNATAPRPQNSLGLAMVRTSTLEQRVVAILDKEKERKEMSPRQRTQLLLLFGGIALVIAATSLTRPTDYHLTPKLQQAMDAIVRQAQLQEDARLSLQIHLERQEEYWSRDKNEFQPQPQATVADIALELTGAKARYRANYHPLVSLWINGPAPYFIEQRTDISDGSQVQTTLSDHHLTHPLRGGGDIGVLAGYQFRADGQVRVTVGLMEGKWQGSNLNFLFLTGPSLGSTRGIEESVLNGVSVIRLQDIFTSGPNVQRRTWWFDPQRDYALVQYEIAHFNFGSPEPTSLTLTTIQQFQKLSEGIWYPTQFTTQNLRYENGLLTDDSFRSTTTLAVLTVLPDGDSSTFQGVANPPVPIALTPTAQKIFDGMIQKYAKCSTFSCTGSYEQKMDGALGMTNHSNFSIRYGRPSKIRMEWTKPKFMGLGAETNTIYTEGGKIFSKLTFLPTIEPDKSIYDAISGAAGVSGTTSYFLPSLLIGKMGYFDHWNLERKPDDTVEGTECYVIELETKGFGIYSLAIRKSDYALVQAVNVFKSEIVDVQRTRAHKENPAWFNDPGGPMKTMVSDTATTDFKNIVLDQPLRDEDFLLSAGATASVATPQTTNTPPLTQPKDQARYMIIDSEGIYPGMVGHEPIQIKFADQKLTILRPKTNGGIVLSPCQKGWEIYADGASTLWVYDGTANIQWVKFDSGGIAVKGWSNDFPEMWTTAPKDFLRLIPATSSNPDGLVKPDAKIENAMPTKRLIVHVQDSNGSPLTGATAKAEGPNISVDLTTGADGLAIISLPAAPPQYLSVRVHKDGFVPKLITWSLDQPSFTLPSDFTLKMEKAQSIGGVVKNDDGQPVEGGHVVLIIRGSSMGGMAQQVFNDIWERRVTTDKDGKWHFDEAPSDLRSLQVTLEHPDYVSNERIDPRPTDDDFKLEKAVLIAHRGIRVDGTVTNDQGKPLAGVDVVFGEAGSGSVTPPNTTTDAVGRFHFGGLSIKSMDMLPPILTFASTNYAPEMVELKPLAGPQTLQVHLKSGKQLRLRLTDQQGHPIKDVTLAADHWRGHRPFGDIRFQSDKDGLITWDHAPDDPITYAMLTDSFQNQDLVLQPKDEVQSIQLKRQTVVSGRVLDATTKRPIIFYDLIFGTYFPPEHPGWSGWARGAALHIQGDSYRYIFSDRARMDSPDGKGLGTEGFHRIRIEAAGYEPEISRPIANDEESVSIDFQLKPAQAIHGVVTAADGTTVKDAQVVVAGPGNPLQIINGVCRSKWDQLSVNTNAQGVYDLPAQEEDYPIAVIQPDAGYFTTTYRALKTSPNVKLLPWGSIALATTAQNDENPPYYVRYVHQDEASYQKERIHFEVYKPSEIQNGAAVYKQLVAGPIKIGKFMQDINEGQVVQIENGKTTQVDLSAGKNAVIGKIAMPPGASADSPLTILRLRPVVPDPPYPPNLTQDQRRVWVQTWRQTPEGKTYGNRATEIPFTIDASGSFRINDVSPGNYQLIAVFLRSLPTGPQAKGDVLGMVQKKFELTNATRTCDLGTLAVQADVH